MAVRFFIASFCILSGKRSEQPVIAGFSCIGFSAILSFNAVRKTAVPKAAAKSNALLFFIILLFPCCETKK